MDFNFTIGSLTLDCSPEKQEQIAKPGLALCLPAFHFFFHELIYILVYFSTAYSTSLIPITCFCRVSVYDDNLPQ